MNGQGFGNMMGAQQQQQHQQQQAQQQQQHPQQHQRLQQVIINQLRQSHRPLPGQWQATLNAEQRAGMLWNIYTGIRLAKPDAPDQQVLQMAFGNENERFVKASSRDDYIRAIKELLDRLQSMRQQNMQNMQATMMQNGNNGANGQAGLMPQTPMQPSGSSQGQNGFQQPFPPQLQHQMQASPLPMTQNPSSMGMENPSVQPQAQQQQNMPQQMQRQPAFTPDEQQKIENMTRALRQRVSPEEEARIRAQIAALPPDRRQMLESRGVDPVMLQCRNKAQQMFVEMRRRQTGQGGQGAQFGQQNQGAGMGRGAPTPGMMQRTPQMGNAQPQQGGLPGNADFDFAQLTNQQADAMRSAQAGHDVVPASNNANMNQMGGFNSMGGGQPGQANGQGMPPGQNRNPGQQPPFNLQQAQRENAIRQMQAQAAAQAQARGQGIPPNQAQAQQMALRNQMNGFNMGNGQPQNGAMPMLTRPMVPPGQQGNATPQPRPQQPGQQMPQNMGPGMNAAQAVQIAQQRAAAAQAQMPGAPQASRASQIPADTPIALRQKMMELPEEQFRLILGRWMAQGARPQWPGNGNVSQPGQQMNPQAVQGAQPGGPGMMGQNMMPQNQQMGGMMNPQAQMNQRLQQELLRRQQQQGLNPQSLQRMDQSPFPPVVTQGIKNNGVNVPDNIRLWGQLKEWASRNPNVISMDKLNDFQRVHYERMTQQAQQQQQANNAGMHGLPGGLPNGAGPLGPGHPNGQAPQAPMMAAGGGNPAQMQQQMAIAAQRQRIFALAQQISPQDIQRIRQQQGQKVANMTDDALRQQIAMIRLQQQRNLQQQTPQQGMMPQPPGGNMGMPQAPNMQQPQRPGQPPQPQPTPQMKPTPQPQASQRPGPPAGQAPNATPKTQAQKSLKRPSSDDVVEVPDPSKPQAPPMQPSQSQQRPSTLTKEQFSTLTPQQQAAYRQTMLQAAQAQGNKQLQGNNAPQGAALQDPLKQQFSAMMHECMKTMGLETRPQIDVSPEGRAQMTADIQKAAQWIAKLDQVMFADWTKHRNDTRSKNIINLRHMLHSQLDAQRKLKEHLTVDPSRMQKIIQNMQTFIKQVMVEQQNERSQPQPGGQEGAQQQQQQQSAAARAQAQGGQGAELNAVNLEKLRQEQLQRPRAPSNAGVKPPAAPTSAQPPFSFGGAQSPNGAPMYAPGAVNSLTPEKLKIPPRKKAKPNGASSASTPAQTTPVHTTSPMVGHKPSPEMSRREVPQPTVPAKPRFTCSHQTCDFSAKGFETKEELELHVKDAHAKVEDPLKFAIESVAEGLGLNADGTPKHPKADINVNNRGRPAPAMAKQPLATKPGQTPQIKTEGGTPATGAAATPMNRVPTQTGIKNSPSANFKTPQMTIKAQTPGSSGAPAMHRTPSKAPKDAAKPIDVAVMEDQNAPKAPLNPWNDCPISPSQLHFMFADEDVAKAMLEMPNSAFIAPEDLEREEREKNQEKVEPRSTTPATTPSPASTKDSKETGISDISENDQLNITIAGDDVDWNRRALESDVDFSSMMDSLFVLDESNNMTLPQNEDNLDMTGPYGFWRDSLGTGEGKIPNWEATELGAPYDFFNAPPAPSDEQDLKDLFGITAGVDGLEDVGMSG